MKWCVYRATIVTITTIIFAIIVGVCMLNISIITNPLGLEILEKTDDTIVLNGGSSTIAVMLGKTDGLEVGMFVPIVDALKPTVNRNFTINVLIICIITLVFLYDAFDIGGLIKEHRARKGVKIDGEVVGYERFFLGLYTIVVEAGGTKYRCRYPICKFEMKRFAKGNSATVWNGGARKIWVDVNTSQPS